MATIKIRKPATPAPPRAPVRGTGAGVKTRPTLAQAQVQRAEREAQYQEQLRQRFGDKPPPPAFVRRDERDDRHAPRPDARRRPDAAAPATRDTRRTSAPAPTGSAPFAPRTDRHDPGDRNGSTPFDARNGRDRPHDRNPPYGRGAGHDRGIERGARPAPGSPVRTDRDDRANPPRQQDGFGSGRQRRPDARPDPRPPAPQHQERHQTAQRRSSSQPVPADSPRRPFDRSVESGRGRDDDDDDRYEHTEHAPGSMRLSKRMSELGIASRREADEWIAKGWVRVDDQIVSELGSRVMPDQRVTVDAKAKYQQAQKVTVLINKPVGYVSGQAEDGYEPALVLVTPANQWREDRSGTRFLREHTKSLVPAGRLDIDSVGLLVLTQDGRVAKQLVGEDGDVEKEYLVRVASAQPGRDGAPTLSEAGLAMLRHGLELDGEALRPATVEWVNADQLRFVLQQGKKRQIRRMCEAVGLQVLGLKRVRIGKVMLGDLPAGQWRYLRMDEGFI